MAHGGAAALCYVAHQQWHRVRCHIQRQKASHTAFRNHWASAQVVPGINVHTMTRPSLLAVAADIAVDRARPRCPTCSPTSDSATARAAAWFGAALAHSRSCPVAPQRCRSTHTCGRATPPRRLAPRRSRALLQARRLAHWPTHLPMAAQARRGAACNLITSTMSARAVWACPVARAEANAGSGVASCCLFFLPVLLVPAS